MSTLKIKDFVLENLPEGFEQDSTKFSILCEKEPIVGTYNIRAKALYIIYKDGDNVTKLYPDSIVQPWFEFTETSRRRLNSKKKPFWINGNTTVKEYANNEYIDYSLTSVKKAEEPLVKAFRKKYNVEEPVVFEGEQLALEL